MYSPWLYARAQIMARRLPLLLSVLALAAAPAGAAAQGSPFSPIPQAPPQQTAPPAPDPAADEDEGSLTRLQEILIAIAGIILVTGIAWAIVRDARQVAPADEAGHAPLDAEGQRVKGSRTPPKQRVQHNRAKARQARQARKRNR